MKDIIPKINNTKDINLPQALLRFQLLDVIKSLYAENAQSDEVHNKTISLTHKIIYRMQIPRKQEEAERLADKRLSEVLFFIDKEILNEYELLYLIANRMIYLTVTGIQQYKDIFPQKTINFIMPLSMHLMEKLEDEGKANQKDILTELIQKYNIDKDA
jgi:hypothetical protein